MGRPPACNPCCNPKRHLCTHRRIEADTPTIEWSDNISAVGEGTSYVVYCSCVDSDGYLYVGGANPQGTGMVQKWSPSGVKLWAQLTETAVVSIATDDTHVWAGCGSEFGGCDHDNLYKYACSDGTEVFAVNASHCEIIYDLVTDGEGGVFGVHEFVIAQTWGEGEAAVSLPCGYCTRWDADGVATLRFGGNESTVVGIGRTTTARCIDRSGSHLWIGSDVWTATTSGCVSHGCNPTGDVAKYTTSGEIVWLSKHNLVIQSEVSFRLGYVTAIRVIGEALYVGYEATGESGYCHLEKWNATDSLFEWGRVLDSDVDTRTTVYDIDADADHVWAAAKYLYKIDDEGTLVWVSPHHDSIYHTVSLDPEFTDADVDPQIVYAGGVATRCTTAATNDQEITECECSYSLHCDCEAGEFGPFGGVYSKHCPCEEISCSIPDTFYGSGCFEGIEVNHTWLYVGDSTWSTIFEIPCGETHPFVVTLTAVEASDVDCSGWEVTYSITHNASGGSGCSSLVTGTASVPECWCSETSPYDHPWFTWQADGIDFGEDCVCCDGTGGGGNDPPGGVEVGCCESPVAETLTVSFGGVMSEVLEITWKEDVSQWDNVFSCDPRLTFSLKCEADEWRWTIRGFGPCEASGVATEVSCDPLILTFTGSVGGTCPCGTGSFSGTITE